MSAIPRIRLWTLAAALAATVLSACTPEPELLNSERIERQFGSYGVDLLSQDSELRRSSLYSIENGRKVCRTYAIVLYREAAGADIRQMHEEITAGASIGAVFRAHGWSVRKHTTHIGSIELSDPNHRLAHLMRLDTPATLAVHSYELSIARGTDVRSYATIVETHHPEYLDEQLLLREFGAPVNDATPRVSGFEELVLVDHWD